jgi:hypothetical protein
MRPWSTRPCQATEARTRDLQGHVEQADAELLRSQPVAQSSDFASVLREVLHRPEVLRTLGVEN